jgi:methylglutaconyl-CoA hydratase
MELVLYSVEEKICSITLNRPEKRNALSPALITALKESFAKAAMDEQVKVVVLKAKGEAFCAGADLEYLQQLQQFTYKENLADSTNLKELLWQIYSHPKVVIAQVQGHALAGGCGLATVCDFCFASSKANFGYTEVKIGFVPALVMVFLLRKIGEAKARQLLLTGMVIQAKEALTIGLINRVSEQGMIETDVQSFAEMLIRSNSFEAMKLTKKLIAEVQSLPIEEALSRAAEHNARARDSEDCRKGIAGFLGKRKIDWH